MEIERVYRVGTSVLLDPLDSVNEVNDFFAHVGERIKFEEDVPYVQYDTRSLKTLENFTPISESTLMEILKEFSLHKSSGIKDISTDFIF